MGQGPVRRGSPGLHRHDLLFLDAEGRRLAVDALGEENPGLGEGSLDALRELILFGAPGIVKRQEKPRRGVIELGFSSPSAVGGVRLRAASAVPESCIAAAISPLDVARNEAYLKNSPHEGLIKKILSEAGVAGVAAGFFGSAALQMVTGLPYRTADSDLDVYVGRAELGRLERFYRAAVEAGRGEGVLVDIEAAWDGEWDVKLKELLSGGRTVLAKGLYGAKLIAINN